MLARIRKLHEPGPTMFVLLLLSADAAFIVLHITITILNPDPSLCSVSGVCVYMDVYRVVKLFWVVILLAYICRLTGQSSYASWIFAFTCFVLDDALHLHQRLGARIAEAVDTYLSPSLHFQPRSFQLALLAFAGILIMGTVACAYVKGAREFRKMSNDIFLFLAALGFFGLIVDVATVLKLQVLVGLGIVEDGGEMVVVSLILWYVFRLAMNNGKPASYLVDLLRAPWQDDEVDTHPPTIHGKGRGSW